MKLLMQKNQQNNKYGKIICLRKLATPNPCSEFFGVNYRNITKKLQKHIDIRTHALYNM